MDIFLRFFVTALISLAPFLARAENRGSLTAQQHLYFRIVIPPILSTKSSSVPETVEITLEDITRRYVDVPVDYTVVCNMRDGFLVVVNMASSGAFRAVEAVNHQTGPSQGFSIHLNSIDRPRKEITFTIAYRLWLSDEGVAPKRYSWPIKTSLIKY